MFQYASYIQILICYYESSAVWFRLALIAAAIFIENTRIVARVAAILYKSRPSRVARRVLDHYVLVSGGGVRVSDVTRGYDVTRERGIHPFNYLIN